MVTPPKGHKFTPRSTPLHVAQLVMQLIRYTWEEISSDPDYPFTLTDDPETTGIIFDTAFNKESNAHRTKPVVSITRGAISSQPNNIGDVAFSSTKKNYKNKTSLVRSSVNITTVAANSGEVDMLSNELFNFLVSMRTSLPALTTIHQIQDISLSEVRPAEEDTRVYQAQASMVYLMQYKWVWQTTDIPLNEIGFFINAEKTMDLPSEAV